MKNIAAYVATLIPFLLLTIIMALIYVAVQQTYRTGANDPQLQLARTIKASLEGNSQPETVSLPGRINLASDLSSFAVLYNAAGLPLRSSGSLNGRMPQLPAGVFAFADKKGEHIVSWQPESSVRMAMVIVKVNTSTVKFVAAGRSLLEVEKRVQSLRFTILVCWLTCLALMIIQKILRHYLAAALVPAGQTSKLFNF